MPYDVTFWRKTLEAFKHDRFLIARNEVAIMRFAFQCWDLKFD